MIRGNFCGTLEKPKGEIPFVSKSKNNKDMLILNASVKVGNNTYFVKMFGGKTKNFKMKDNDGENVTIDWDDRFDEDVLDSVPYFRKTHIKVGDEDREFLSTYDAIKFIDENYDDLFKGKKLNVRVKGQKNAYNGKISDNFSIQNIFEAKEDDKETAKLDVEFFWNKDCVDTDDWSDSKKIYINGYVQDYDRDSNGQKYFPHKVVLNCSKIDFDNEIQKKRAEFYKKRLVVKNKTFQKDMLQCVYVQGAEEQDDFTIDDLTDEQKELVEIGLKSVEDFKPKGKIFGDFTREYRIVNFNTSGDYKDGRIDTELSEDEFLEDVISVSDSKTETKKKSSKKKEKEEEFEDDLADLEDLFSDPD